MSLLISEANADCSASASQSDAGQQSCRRQRRLTHKEYNRSGNKKDALAVSFLFCNGFVRGREPLCCTCNLIIFNASIYCKPLITCDIMNPSAIPVMSIYHYKEDTMSLNVFGGVHLIYLAITLSLSVGGLFLAKRFAKTERSQKIIFKSIAALLLVWILINRLSQVFRYSNVRWEQIIPDSFCGMTSLVLSLAVLLGKKDNPVYHFVWSLGLVGALITIFYPTFLDQGPSIFYLPTIITNVILWCKSPEIVGR